jgi:hypothetical protein
MEKYWKKTDICGLKFKVSWNRHTVHVDVDLSNMMDFSGETPLPKPAPLWDSFGGEVGGEWWWSVTPNLLDRPPKHWIVSYSKRDHNRLHWPTCSHVLLLRTTTSFFVSILPSFFFSIAPFDRSEWIDPLDPRKWVSSPHADQTCPTYWDNISPKMWCQFCFLVTPCDPQ